jgi:hypothetical protein
MIESDDMKHAVNHEPRQLFADRDTIFNRVTARDVRRDIDVTEQRASAGAPSKTKGDHVGGTAMSKVTSIQQRDVTAIDEGNGQARRPNSLGPEHGARDLRDAPPRQRHPNARCVDVDDMRHTEANSDVTPPLDVG